MNPHCAWAIDKALPTLTSATITRNDQHIDHRYLYTLPSVVPSLQPNLPRSLTKTDSELRPHCVEREAKMRNRDNWKSTKNLNLPVVHLTDLSLVASMKESSVYIRTHQPLRAPLG